MSREKYLEALADCVRRKDALSYVLVLRQFDFRHLEPEDMKELETFFAKPEWTKFDSSLESHRAAEIYYAKLKQAKRLPYFTLQQKVCCDQDDPLSEVLIENEPQQSPSSVIRTACIVC